MRRRELIAGLSATAAASPLRTWAKDRMRRVGMLSLRPARAIRKLRTGWRHSLRDCGSWAGRPERTSRLTIVGVAAIWR